MTTNAALYARISSDSEGTGLGVARQIEDCTREAQRRGWQIADEYVDNDTSATRSKRRDHYERMLADIRAGRVTGLVVWDVDRLTRTPRELEDIIDLADRHGLALASVGGEIDLATPQGRMTARIKGTVARHDTDQQSRRLKRKFLERAQAGKPHSFAAFGYRRCEDGTDEIDPDQAEMIRQAARMLLAGQSLRSVTVELNRRGYRSPRGLEWASTTLRQIMVRDRNAGIRTHRGQPIGPGAWPPIYDRGTHDRVVALLTDPGRKTSRGTARKHLLTGIARCGREGCDGTMVVNHGRVYPDGRRQPPAYTCQTCTRIRRKQADVDDLVAAQVIARLERPDALDALTAGDAAAAGAARNRVAELQARLDRAADQYADDALTASQLARITAKLRPQIAAAEQVRDSALPANLPTDIAGPGAAGRWEAAPLDVKRALIEALVTVTILPQGSGRAFDPEMVRVLPVSRP